MSSALARVRKAKAVKKENDEARARGEKVISEREKKFRSYCRIELTVLRIVFISGEVKEVFNDYYITRYSDLQREIAKNTPGKNGIFVIQKPNGDIMSSDNFTPEHFYKVKEISRKHVPIIYPLVPIKWEFRRYHGAPRDWIDPVEAARLAEEARLAAEAERLAAEQKAREEAEEAARRKEEETKALIGDDADWDDMLNIE